ncbi:MAG: hypothetical protein AB7O73_06850 [Bacteroidia bacterium]
MKRWIWQNSLCLILLLPLLFINIKNSHDWGDDFAQYLHQAKQIANHQDQNENKFISNKEYFIGPNTYPTGFPLLLAPIIKFYGVNFKALNIYLSVFWLLACFVGFLILKQNFSFLTSLGICLFIAYNPMMLQFKTEILSDLPFTCFSLLCLWLINNKTKMLHYLLVGILIGFSIHIRTIGWVLLIVFIISEIMPIAESKKINQINKKLFSSLFAFLVTFFSIKFVFPTQTNYPGLFGANNWWLNFNHQFSYNIDKLATFFNSYNSQNFNYIGIIASSTLICFSILGIIMCIKNKEHNIYLFYIITYLTVILSFEYGDSGMRFLFPILFLLFQFAIKALKETLIHLNLFHRSIPILFIVIILLSYIEPVRKIIDKSDEIYEGPQKSTAIEVFTYIKENCPDNSIIHFDKPRTLAFFAERKSFALNSYSPAFNLRDGLNKFNANYILINHTLTNWNIGKQINDPSFYKEVFKNEDFILLAITRQ